MITKYSVSLNNIPLHSLDDDLVLMSITEPVPQINYTTASKSSRLGQFVLASELKQKEVTVQFAIRDFRDYAHRARVLQKVTEWAMGGGELRLDYRRGQYLGVVCGAMPQLNDVKEWNKPYSLTFRAYAVPQWQSDIQMSVSRSGNGTAILSMDGTADTLLEVEAKNSSGSTVNSITISANGNTMTFTTLGLANNETFCLDYGEQMIQRIRIKNSSGVYRSALSSRYYTSDDEIVLTPGANTITVSGNLNWKLIGRGRWLG